MAGRTAPPKARLTPAVIAALLLPATPAFAADTLDAAIGKALFERRWVAAPASTKADDGLGPLFTAASCNACHPRAGAGADRAVRFGNGTGGDPIYGRQLQPFSVAGLRGEGVARVTDRPEGAPAVRLDALAYGPLAPGTHVGLRVPPALAGLATADIAALGDDAILANKGVRGGRGRALPDGRLGRFGWKASAASLEDQIAGAFSLDMGLSTAAAPDPYGDCTPAEADCRAAPNGSQDGAPEIAPAIVAALGAFLAALPSPRPAEDAAGAALFAAMGCADCHRPALTDGQGRTARLFSDLLLHDMGPGLDEGIAEPGARSSEWRTAPLAGLGARAATGRRLLHDGRAPTLAAAIAAHGGDAAFAAKAFADTAPDARERLETYLKGL